MRLSVLQENLSKGLSIVGRAVSSRSTLPVLGNILLSTDDDRLKLAATNLEVGVSCWLGAQVEDDGAITLPARLLTDWVNSMPPDKIDMEMVVRTMSMNLKCARFESNIKGIDASEFPLIPTADGANVACAARGRRCARSSTRSLSPPPTPKTPAGRRSPACWRCSKGTA